MSLDLPSLHRAIDRLEGEVAELRRLAKAAEAGQTAEIGDAAEVASPAPSSPERPSSPAPASAEAPGSPQPPGVGVALPPEVRVPRPAVVAACLRDHPDVAGTVGEMAAAVVVELQGERSEIELDLYEDPEIDDYRYLTFYVRVPEYDGTLLDRLDTVAEQFDDRFTHTSDMVLITTDHRPMS